ncbi:MAG: phage tail tube protein [Pseudolabrys sp.]
MGQRIAGIAYVKVDGDQYALKGNFTVSPSRVERTGIAGQDQVHGYEESPRIPFIEGDISLVPELSVEALEAMTDVTVTAELANGKVYVLRNAWTKAAFELNTKEGTTRVRWEGMDCNEI